MQQEKSSKKIRYLLLLLVFVSAVILIGKMSFTFNPSPEKDSNDYVKNVHNKTKEEAKEMMEAFLRKNSSKYDFYGEFQDLEIVSGDYTNDGVLDYFFDVYFYPGGDYVYVTHFFYESDLNQIRELSIQNATDFFKNIYVKKINQAKIIGSAHLWSAFSGEHFAVRHVEAEFRIQGDKIVFDDKYIPKFLEAENEISAELDSIWNSNFQ